MAAPARTPTLPWALFGLDGRVSREVFWLGNIGCFLIAAIFAMPSLDPNTNEIHFAPLSPFVFAGAFWVQIALAAKRLHDRNLSGWFAALLVVPFVGIVPFFVIGLMPGTKGANTYGPAPNTRGPI